MKRYYLFIFTLWLMNINDSYSMYYQEEYPDINTFISVEKEAECTNLPAIRNGIDGAGSTYEKEGKVVARVLVNESGQYVRHKIVASSNASYSQAVEPHVRKLRFTAAVDSDGPVKYWVNVAFIFRNKPNTTSSTNPDPNAFILVDNEPEVVNMDLVKQQIGYPKLASAAGIEGTVILRILVNENGDYTKHMVIKNPHSQLTKGVEKYIEHLTFLPAIQGNKAVQYWTTIPFRFKL